MGDEGGDKGSGGFGGGRGGGLGDPEGAADVLSKSGVFDPTLGGQAPTTKTGFDWAGLLSRLGRIGLGFLGVASPIPGMAIEFGSMLYSIDRLNISDEEKEARIGYAAINMASFGVLDMGRRAAELAQKGALAAGVSPDTKASGWGTGRSEGIDRIDNMSRDVFSSTAVSPTTVPMLSAPPLRSAAMAARRARKVMI